MIDESNYLKNYPDTSLSNLKKNECHICFTKTTAKLYEDEDGQFAFEGDAKESARIFFNYLRNEHDMWVRFDEQDKKKLAELGKENKKLKQDAIKIAFTLSVIIIALLIKIALQ